MISNDFVSFCLYRKSEELIFTEKSFINMSEDIIVHVIKHYVSYSW